MPRWTNSRARGSRSLCCTSSPGRGIGIRSCSPSDSRASINCRELLLFYALVVTFSPPQDSMRGQPICSRWPSDHQSDRDSCGHCLIGPSGSSHSLPARFHRHRARAGSRRIHHGKRCGAKLAASAARSVHCVVCDFPRRRDLGVFEGNLSDRRPGPTRSGPSAPPPAGF